MSRSDQHTVAKCFSYLFSADLRPELPKIKSHTLIIEAGGGQGAIPENIFKEQYQGLAGVKLVRDPKTRHFIMMDDPDFLYSQIKGFLDK